VGHTHAFLLKAELNGALADGMGAAIGGTGTEGYDIEGSAAESNTAREQVVVEMSSREAISPLTTELWVAHDHACQSVRRTIKPRPAKATPLSLQALARR